MTIPTEREVLIARLRVGYTLHQNDTPDLDAADELMGLAADMLEADAQNSYARALATAPQTIAHYDPIGAWNKGFEEGIKAQQVAVPQGWKLVPVSPTLEMSVAGKGAELFAPSARSASVVYRAMIAAAPQPPQAERVPMTEEELEDGFNSPSVDVAPTDTVESVFTEGARFAERHHGIGAKP